MSSSSARTRSVVAMIAFASAIIAGHAGNASGAEATPAQERLSIIPAPARVTTAPGVFALSAQTIVVAPPPRSTASNGEAARVATYFADLLAHTRGIRLTVTPREARNGDGGALGAAASRIEFRLDASAPAGEGYDLEVSPRGARVQAREARGLFYGAITLWQMATSNPNAKAGSPAILQSVHITDAPRFAWRGFLLDSARHYQSPAFIKKMLDAMALHKLNTFQWHLTDDQGWRLQIKKYPRLTEVGAWSVPAGAAPAADIDAKTGKPRRLGGYYTQDEVRDIVRYAAERFITIVPEIEMPGHAQAALAAYPERGTDAAAPPVSSDWGVHTYLYNVDDATFVFLEDVLTEVMALFPGAYIHVGGDEAVKNRWRSSSAVQQRMRELGVANEAALQGYFTHRMESFLRAHGRKLIGWDEILEGGLPASATVMSWRGTKGAIDASKQGHDVVLSPAPDLYLDYLQSDLPDEPPGRPSTISLQQMYEFNVLPPEIGGDATHHVLGAQINAWTEHMRTPDRVEHAAFPRMAAFAEVVWSQPAQRSTQAPGAALSAPNRGPWSEFVSRLPAQFARYKKLGIQYADSAFAVKITGTEPVELSNQAKAGDIRYTLNGTQPTLASNLYTTPLTLKLPATLKATTFISGYRMATPRVAALTRISALTRTNEQLRSCASKLVLRLEDDAPLTGPRAVFNVDILDPCWIWEKADLSRVHGIAASVGQLPFNFQIGDDVKKIPLWPAQTPGGELEVRQDSCDGERIAVLPLAPATENQQVTALPRVSIAQGAASGTHDLCLRFTRRSVDPMWVIQSVQLFE